MKWMKARKKPVIVDFRNVDKREVIETREGKLFAYPDNDYVIKGVKGELYPIAKDIFYETYEVLCPSCCNMEINSEEGMTCGRDECNYQHI